MATHADDDASVLTLRQELEAASMHYEAEDDAEVGAESRDASLVRLSEDEKLTEALDRLLSLNEPKVSPGMMKFMSKDQVMMGLVRYITRCEKLELPYLVVSPGDEVVVPDPAASPDVFLAHREELLKDRRNPGDDEETVKKGYAAMKFLTHQSIFARNLLQTMCPVVVRELLRVFEVTSKGSFYHASAVLMHMLRVIPKKFIDVMLGPKGIYLPKRLGPMLLHIHHPAVADLFIALVTLKAPPTPSNDPFRPQMAAAIPAISATDFFNGLLRWRLFEQIAAHNDTSLYPDEHVNAAGDCLARICRTMRVAEQATPLLRSLAAVPSVLPGMVDVAISPPVETPTGAGAGDSEAATSAKSEQPIISNTQIQAFQSIDALTKCAFERAIIISMPNNPSPEVKVNCIPAILVYARLMKCIPQLCQWMIDVHAEFHRRYGTLSESSKTAAQRGNSAKVPYDPKSAKHGSALRYTGYTVRVNFGSARLAAVQLLVTMVKHNVRSTLGCIPDGIWKVLVAWYLEYRHNNLYHNLFAELWCAAMHAGHDCIQPMLQQSKAVSVFIAHYKSGPNSSAKGTILRMLNTMRLKADSMLPTSHLRKYLHGHDAWKAFVPELLAATKLQCSRARLVPQPVPPTMQGRLMPPRPPLPKVAPEEVDVELGSTYAMSLGFAGVEKCMVPDVQAPSRHRKRKKKRRGRTQSVGSASEGDDSTSVASTDTEDSNSGATDDLCRVSSPTTWEGEGVTGPVSFGAGTATASEADPESNNAESNSTGSNNNGKKKRKRNKKKKKKH